MRLYDASNIEVSAAWVEHLVYASGTEHMWSPEQLPELKKTRLLTIPNKENSELWHVKKMSRKSRTANRLF